MLSGRTTLQAGACAGAPPRLNRAQKPRIARQTRHRCSAAAQPVDGGASSVAAAAASCPYSAAKAALQQFLPQQQVQQQQQWQQQQWGAAGAEGFVQTPGPHPLSVESVAMVTTIFTEASLGSMRKGTLPFQLECAAVCVAYQGKCTRAFAARLAVQPRRLPACLTWPPLRAGGARILPATALCSCGLLPSARVWNTPPAQIMTDRNN